METSISPPVNGAAVGTTCNSVARVSLKSLFFSFAQENVWSAGASRGSRRLLPVLDCGIGVGIVGYMNFLIYAASSTPLSINTCQETLMPSSYHQIGACNSPHW